MPDASNLAPALWGIPVVADSAARELAFPVATRSQDQRVYNKATGTVERWSGSLWVADFGGYPIASGEAGVVNTAFPIGHVSRYGAIGDGATDATAAIQAAMTAITLGGAPSSTTRRGTGEIRFPGGDFVITSPITATSLQYFRLRGVGAATRIMCSGALTCMIDLNGVAYFSMEDIQLTGKTSADTCTDAIRLRWDIVTAARSTTVVNFQRVYILGLKFVNGMNIGAGSAGFQVSETSYNSCLVAGQWTVGEATWWQKGFLIGTGTFGNNLMHSLYHPMVQACRYGVYVDASQAAVYGAQVQGSEADFFVGDISYFTVSGHRSETSQRLLVTGGPNTTASAISLSDIDWHGDAINADGFFIQHKTGGVLKLTNVGLQAVTGGVTPKVQMSSAAPAILLVDGIETPSAIHQSYTGNATYHTVIIKGHTVRAADNSTTSQVGEYRSGATTDIQWAPFTAAADVWWKRQSDASMLLGNNQDLAIGNSGYVAGRLRMGAYYLWVDSSGRLRIKSGAPTSDTDGTIVGLQS